MKAILKTLLYYGFMPVMVVSFMTSCGDDTSNDPYDINYAYIRTPSITNYAIRYLEDGSFVKTIEEKSTLIPVRCTKPAPEDMAVTFEIDNSLVDAYNKAHQTDYVFLKNAKLENATLTIKKGEYISADSLKVVYTDMGEFKSGPENFILPVKIQQAGSGGTISENNTFYLTYKSVMVKIGEENSPTGAKIADRSGWTVYWGERVTQKLTDGKNNGKGDYEAWNEGSTPQIFTVNLGKKEKVSCVNLTYYSSSYASANADIEVSADGQTYTSMGNVGLALTDQHYLCFYILQDVQYIKISLSGYLVNSLVALSEINVYTAQ